MRWARTLLRLIPADGDPGGLVAALFRLTRPQRCKTSPKCSKADMLHTHGPWPISSSKIAAHQSAGTSTSTSDPPSWTAQNYSTRDPKPSNAHKPQTQTLSRNPIPLNPSHRCFFVALKPTSSCLALVHLAWLGSVGRLGHKAFHVKAWLRARRRDCSQLKAKFT